eukprot:CAMPEP_0177577992 /NCGR_PEP_ID=MMETSP0419_2-20121207/83_1 /TAXON_ID=582737 /ORGANISM="Tetraselmis sp., Strain GSL018" /LENGTH=195 /DNA_ID=CAMNT_0019066351 /DNA_START=289 /DNA_END=876 /DNA_ORIENTATION=+
MEKALPENFRLCDWFLAPNIDEKAVGLRSNGASAGQLVRAVARAKVEALLPRLRETSQSEKETPHLLVTADQVIVFEDAIREKPAGPEQALEFLLSYGFTGSPAECVTCVAVCCVESGICIDGVDVAKQYFHPVPQHVAESVVAKGQVLQCAGSFAVEEPLLQPFLGEREGEFESVQGMPIELTRTLLLEAARSL